MTTTLHLSKIIITSDKEPIFNGGLLTRDSKIIQVGKKEDFGDLKNFEVIDHGGTLLCPGFINLHTHLLYSKCQRSDESLNLFNWLEDLVDHTSHWTEKDFIDSVNYGINQALSCGTTFIVENTPSYTSAQVLANSPLKALIGLEIFGSDEEKADEIFSHQLSALSIQHSAKNIEFCFSPHAPYDVSVPLWKKLIEWSEENKKPILTHLEESPDEKLWWQNKSGSGIKFWKKITKLESKLKYWKKYNSGIDFLNKNNLLSKNIIATHLSQASKEDLTLLKEKNISLVHCPRSNYYLNNGAANLKLWNELGFLWGAGTDSIASNKNLDLLEELRFLIDQQNLIYNFKLSARDAFKAITSNAAKILSLDSRIGVLKEGYKADFLIYNLKDKSGCTYKDPYHLVVWDMDSKTDLKEVWISGKKVWISEHVLNKI